MVTPNNECKELAKALEISSLFLKREDLHPYGSHKGRSIPTMMDIYIKEGIKNFAVSSSGNAGLAAAHHAFKLGNIKLDVLVGRHIVTKKLEKLKGFESENIKVTMHDRPLQTLFNKIKDPEVRGLRQSIDNKALVGYSELAKELLEISDLKAVFIGTSSGTTAEALAEYFNSINKKIEIHMVQTSSCHPIADAFVNNDILDESSIADAIVDYGAARKDTVTDLIKESGGSGWIASNEQIRVAQDITRKYTGISISPNSALSVAGVMQAVYTGKGWSGSVACLICGD